MAILSFTLAPESIGKLHDAIACLGKFSEAVSIEATRNHLVLSALNSTKSAYASFKFANTLFFVKYAYNPPRTNGVAKEKFTCRMYNKGLLSVFKGRSVDPLREKETMIEKCEVVVEDGAPDIRSRFVTRMLCRHGVLKTYRLTFEQAAAAHAVFDDSLTRSRWSMSSRVLRDFVEHFGPGTEQLDMLSEDGKMCFTSYTEKIMSGNEVLKQPLHTSISVDTLDFSEFSVQDKLHVVISVKDFKAIVAHAGILDTSVSVAYSQPSRPLRLIYGDVGVSIEFILMTIGEHRAGSSTPVSAQSRAGSKRPAHRQALDASESRTDTAEAMPPPRRPYRSTPKPSAPSQMSRPSPPATQPSTEASALFFTDADDDRKWDPRENSDGEAEEVLGWDTSVNRDPGLTFSREGVNRVTSQYQSPNDPAQHHLDDLHLPPTQRMSQIHGLFDAFQ